ncbi:S-adenosyl-L-methionine-dependent methyltransferase [Mycena galopus ATCC 62051]|nr:S-adenosyl-L-methionine-dependent methyltransferase [Mycena galopus ATCC 62051]
MISQNIPRRISLGLHINAHIPPTMPLDFDKQSYWHARFTSETHFEWLVSSETLVQILAPHLARLETEKPAPNILHLGPGTSDLQNHLRAHGFQRVTNVDYEPLAVERGRQLEEKQFGDVRMRWVVVDVTKLGEAFPREKFDMVVDKGTADAVSCGGEEALMSMAREVKGVLAQGGVWLSLSYSTTRFAFDEGMIPFEVEVVARIPTPKAKQMEPDVFHWCYQLRPM